MSFLGLLGGRKNVGISLEIAFQTEKLREIGALVRVPLEADPEMRVQVHLGSGSVRCYRRVG